MTKMIVKEIVITLLICLAILLILGIILYDYNPLNKIVPEAVAYTTPNEIKEEIDDGNVEDVLGDGYNVIFRIENADLDKYKKSKRYVPGKAHPFGDVSSSIGDELDPDLAIPELDGDGGVAGGSATKSSVKSSSSTSSSESGSTTTTPVKTK